MLARKRDPSVAIAFSRSHHDPEQPEGTDMADDPKSLHFTIEERRSDPATIAWLVDGFAHAEPDMFRQWIEIEASPYVYDPEDGMIELHDIAERVFIFLEKTCTFDSASTASAVWLQMKSLVTRRAKD